MVGHRHTPVVLAAATNSAARELHIDNNTHISRDSVGSGFGRRFYGMTRVLKQAPYAPHIKVREIGILLSGYFRGRAETAHPWTKPQSPASCGDTRLARSAIAPHISE
jgi:hypothetical protein